MKYLLILALIYLSLNSYSQTIKDATIKSSKTRINSIGDNSIELYLKVNFPEECLDYKINDESFLGLNSENKFKLISKKNKNLVNQNEEIYIGVSIDNSIVFSITNVSKELINLLIDSVADIYIQPDDDIIFKALKNDDISTLETFKVSVSQIEKNTRNNLQPTNSMAKELINARGGNIFLTQNQFDFGLIPAENSNSNKTEYSASFKYRTKYSFLDEIPLFFSTEGLVGTNSKDSLNYISIYPINYNLSKGTHELIGQFGIEGNQVFSNFRLSGNFYWNGILPNLVDFTFGEDRLRLKPVIRTGLKIYKEVENNRSDALDNNELANQIFSDFYYYIPIQKIYSLILDGSIFYDFNSMLNPDKKVMFNYSLILGIDIPKTDFKTIFKFVKGTNGISYEKNDYLMVGLMINLFDLK